MTHQTGWSESSAKMIKLLKKRIDEKIKLVLVLSGKKVYISPLLNIISITHFWNLFTTSSPFILSLLRTSEGKARKNLGTRRPMIADVKGAVHDEHHFEKSKVKRNIYFNGKLKIMV